MCCAYTRPRYPVSVYRTIGPLDLVLFFELIIMILIDNDFMHKRFD